MSKRCPNSRRGCLCGGPAAAISRSDHQLASKSGAHAAGPLGRLSVFLCSDSSRRLTTSPPLKRRTLGALKCVTASNSDARQRPLAASRLPQTTTGRRPCARVVPRRSPAFSQAAQLCQGRWGPVLRVPGGRPVWPGDVIDVYVPRRRDSASARTFLRVALAVHGERIGPGDHRPGTGVGQRGRGAASCRVAPHRLVGEQPGRMRPRPPQSTVPADAWAGERRAW